MSRFAGLAVLIFAGYSFSQNPSLSAFQALAYAAPTQSTSLVAPKDPQATALAQRALAALGATNLSPGETVLASGTLTVSGTYPIVFPILMKSRGTDQLRSELTTSKGVRVTIIRGGYGKIVQPDGTFRWLSTENTVSQRVAYIPALSLLAEHQTTTTSAQYIGTTSLEGGSADVIALAVYEQTGPITASEQSTNTRKLFYIDHDTGLVLRVQEMHYSENGSGDSQSEETRYSDYRQIQGVMIPFHQQTYVNGQVMFDLALSDVTFGALLSDSDFSL